MDRRRFLRASIAVLGPPLASEASQSHHRIGFIRLGANLVTISALGLLRLGAKDFRKRVQTAL